MSTPEGDGERLPQKQPKEIERKFLVVHLPENLDSYSHDEIRQGYLVLGKDGSEARLRDRAGSYTMTVKSKGALSRGEWEVPITQEQFETLWPATEGKRVEKIRFTVPSPDGSIIELDIYDGELMGLVSAEVEFPTEEAASTFEAPSWLGDDVTDLASMKNQSLAENGFPAELLEKPNYLPGLE